MQHVTPKHSKYKQSKHKQSKRAQGTYFETLAEQYLQAQGLITVTKNFRKRVGEIDLIMHNRQQIIFIEVKFRHSTAFGTPLESINTQKINRIRQVALLFLKEHTRYRVLPLRFDVVSILPKTTSRNQLDYYISQNIINQPSFNIDWISNAF